MKPSTILAVVVSLLAGAFLMYMFRPAPQAPSQTELIDGKYLVVHGSDGIWIYEKGEKGFTPKVKELSPMGLEAIWGLQGKFLPYSIDMGGGSSLVNVPATQYSTETGTFQVIHRFYRFLDDKLVEVNLESLKPAKPN